MNVHAWVACLQIIDILLEAKVFDPLLQSVCKLRGRSPDTMYQQFTAYMLASKDSWKKYMHINSSIGTNKYKAGMHLLFQCFLDCTSKLQSKIVSMHSAITSFSIVMLLAIWNMHTPVICFPEPVRVCSYFMECFVVVDCRLAILLSTLARCS